MRGRQLALMVLFLASAGLFVVQTECRADDSAAKTSPSKAAATNSPAKPARVKPAPLSAEREAEALAFAREHHPELAVLIEKLRKDNRRQFDQALRQLSLDRDRLVRLKRTAPAAIRPGPRGVEARLPCSFAGRPHDPFAGSGTRG